MTITTFVIVCFLVSMISSCSNQQENRIIVNFVAESYNDTLSQKVNHFIDEKVGRYAKPNIRIYDQIADKDNYRYVEAKFSLDKNHLDSDNSFKLLKEFTIPIMSEQIADKPFVGNITYIYEGSDKKKVRTHVIN